MGKFFSNIYWKSYSSNTSVNTNQAKNDLVQSLFTTKLGFQSLGNGEYGLTFGNMYLRWIHRGTSLFSIDFYHKADKNKTVGVSYSISNFAKYTYYIAWCCYKKGFIGNSEYLILFPAGAATGINGDYYVFGATGYDSSFAYTPGATPLILLHDRTNNVTFRIVTGEASSVSTVSNAFFEDGYSSEFNFKESALIDTFYKNEYFEDTSVDPYKTTLLGIPYKTSFELLNYIGMLKNKTFTIPGIYICSKQNSVAFQFESNPLMRYKNYNTKTCEVDSDYSYLIKIADYLNSSATDTSSIILKY